jgi:inner membrane protein
LGRDSGTWAADRTRADGKYFAIANEGKEFIVTDGKGAFYKTGQQILSDRITAAIGNPATTQLQTVSFMDEEIAPKLQEIVASQPNALILLSGSIVVDLPENVRIPVEANRFQTAKVADKTVTLTFHPIELALQQLGEQYVTGTLTVKVISPRPQ